MNLGHEWVDLLKAGGFDAMHWSAVASPDAKDSEIMQWSRENDAVIVTQDLDFGHLHAIQNSKLPSVIQIRHDDLRPSSIGGFVVTAINAELNGLATGAILTVEPPSARIRPLPIIPEDI